MQTNETAKSFEYLIAERETLLTDVAKWRGKALDLAQLIHELDQLETEARDLKQKNQERGMFDHRTQIAVLTVQLASVTHTLRALEWAINRRDDSGETLAGYWAECELFADEMTRFDH